MRLYLLSIVFFASFIFTGCDPAPIDPPPDPVLLKDTTIVNMPYGADGSQKLDLGLPANRSSATPLVIVVHGGGWSAGDKNELT